MIVIAPSILSADFLNLGQQIKAIENASADRIHIDVMDGHFVPNLTMGPLIIAAIKKIAKIPLDVHLMIENAECYIDTYLDAGADYLTIHEEGVTHLERVIKQIKSRNKKAGVALNPSTSESTLEYVIEDLDLVLVMSVNPGFGGQHFLPSALRKVSAIKSMIARSNNKRCEISIDGGINDQNAVLAIRAGATSLVAGSYIFSAKDYKVAIDNLRASSLTVV